MAADDLPSGDGRQNRKQARRQSISEMVMAEGAIRIEQLAERFGTSVMTVHRDLDELESRGLLRKSRGVASATSTSLVESSDVYRAGRERAEKEAIALAALELVEPGQAIFLDDSTTVLHLARHLHSRTPLTVITNVLTQLSELAGIRDMTVLALGGQYYSWCSAYMGRMTTQAISRLHADVFFMSTSAISEDVAFHQTLETIDVKRAMFDASSRRILLTDHTKFDKRALHALVPLREFDTMIVDDATPAEHVERIRAQGVEVIVAGRIPHDRIATVETA